MAKKKAQAVTQSAEALEYFKYNPETDGDQTFNIELALNQNWDKTKAEFVRQEGVIEAVKGQIEDIDVSWDGVTGKPEQFPPSPHTHTKSQITDFPASLPANGGNADTVGGLQAWQLGTLNAGGIPHYTSFPLYCQFNKNGDSRFRLFVEGHTTSVDHSYNTDKVKNRDLASEVDGLKQSVVNGKQAVVNAINDRTGYNTGLTTNHTHDDYAWYIRTVIPKCSATLPAGTSFTITPVVPMKGVSLPSNANVTYVLFGITSANNRYGYTVVCPNNIYVAESGVTGWRVVNANTPYTFGSGGTNAFRSIYNPSGGNITITNNSGYNVLLDVLLQ